MASLIQAADGNFYGTTPFGGGGGCSVPFSSSGCGTVFKMTIDGALTVLHAFSETEGYWPDAALIQGTDGNFYGTTSAGISPGAGTVFTL